MTFFRCLRMDVKRLFRSGNFYFAVLLTAFVTLVSLLPDIWSYGSRMSVYSMACFHGIATNFFLIMTVLVALPFGLSYREDVKHNYLHCLTSRASLASCCWSHVVVAAAGAFLTVFLGYALCYGAMGLFFPMIHPEEAEALRKGSYEVYENLILGPVPILYFVCTIATEAAGYAFLAVFALMLSAKISNPFVVLSMPAIFYYATVIVGTVGRLPGILRWDYILTDGGWLARNIGDIRVLMPCIFLYFAGLTGVAGLVFEAWAERRRKHG